MNASRPPGTLPVILLARTFPPEDIGGVASFCRTAALALDEAGLEVHVLVPRISPGPERIEGNLYIHTVKATGGQGIRFFRYLAALLRLRKQYPGAVVLVGYWIPTAIAAWLISFFLPVRYGIFLHGAEVWNYPSRTQQWLLRAVCRRAQRLLAVTHYTRQEVETEDLNFQARQAKKTEKSNKTSVKTTSKYDDIYL